MYRLLFLCTGNYYRSRFAEILFNARAAAYDVPWQAFSRGLALPRDGRNVGPLSPFARQALETLGITSPEMARYPLPVEAQDFQAAHRIIALDEAEHKPYLQAHYALWLPQVSYWHIRDTVPTSVYDPLHEITRAVDECIARLCL